MQGHNRAWCENLRGILAEDGHRKLLFQPDEHQIAGAPPCANNSAQVERVTIIKPSGTIPLTH